jgi:hypothetical protein
LYSGNLAFAFLTGAFFVAAYFFRHLLILSSWQLPLGLCNEVC